MALTERLQILVTADGKGAVNEFSRIGATAEKELGRTDDRLKRLSSGLVANGTQIAVAGGLATAGIFALAKASGDYEEAASAAGVIFGDSAEAIEDFGTQAIKTAGLSRRAAVEAANTFGTFGKAAGLTGDDLADFSIELTNLAGDLASFKNTSTEEAILAIGAALRGESEPIRRYGVLLDDATLKAKALELGIYDGVGALDQQSKVLAAQAVILQQTSDAQGDFARTSDSLSNQTRSFTAEVENLKVGLGQGAVPVFSELVGAANDALTSFQNLSPETQTLVGRIGAIGAVGVTVAGGFTVLAGGALRLVDTVGDLASRLRTADGTLSRFGRTLQIVGGIGAGFALVGVADQIRQSVVDPASEAEQSLKRLRVELDRGNTEDAIRAFAQSVGDVPDNIFSEIPEVFGFNMSLLPGLASETIEDIETAFEQLSVPEQKSLLDALEAQRAAFGRNTQEFEDYGIVIDNLSSRYQLNVDAAAAAVGGARREYSLFGQVLDGAAAGLAKNQEAADSFNTTFDETTKLIKLSGDLFKLSEDRAKSFLGAIEGSSAIDDLLGASLDLRDSSAALLDGIGALAGVNVEEVASGFGDISDEAAEALRDVLAVGDDAQASIAAALQFQGAPAARAKADDIRAGLVGVLKAADVADDQIQYLLTSIGLTPEQVETAITVSGTDEAIAKLTLLRDFYQNEDGSSGIPDEVTTQVNIAIAEGRFVDAANLISIWVKDQEDGSISDPLLIALGLGDTGPASGEVETWKTGEEQKPPAEIPVDADTNPANESLNNLRSVIPLFGGAVKVTADTSQALENLRQLQRAIPIFGTAGGAGIRGGFDVKIPNRATGGAVGAGRDYFVNEPALGGELFRPSTNGFVMNAADTDRLLRGVEALVGGGGGNSYTINVQGAPSPMATAEEIILAARAERHLVGA